MSDDKQIDEALTHATRARSLRPGYDLYEMLYGDLLMAKGELDAETLDEVIVSYQSALSTRPNVVNLQRNIGKALSMRGRFEEAAWHFEKATQLEPSDAATYVELANTLARLRRFDEAAQAYQDALTADPTDSYVLGVLGTIRMAQNRPAEALDLYRRGLQADPKSVRVMVNLAMALATTNDPRLRNPTEAKQLADSASQLVDPGNREIWRDLATTYAALGDKEATQAAIEKAKP